MIRRERLTALAVAAVGAIVVVGIPTVVGEGLSRSVLIGLSVVGAGLMWGGAVWDDTICRRSRDERQAEIHYRAGYNTMIALTVLLGTGFLVAVNLDRTVPNMVLWGMIVVGLAVYFGTVAWLKRRM